MLIDAHRIQRLPLTPFPNHGVQFVFCCVSLYCAWLVTTDTRQLCAVIKQTNLVAIGVVDNRPRSVPFFQYISIELCLLTSSINRLACLFGFHKSIWGATIAQQNVVHTAVVDTKFCHQVAAFHAETGLGQCGVNEIATCLRLAYREVSAGIHSLQSSNFCPHLL